MLTYCTEYINLGMLQVSTTWFTFHRNMNTIICQRYILHLFVFQLSTVAPS